MKAKQFIIGILACFIPFLFAINILRTQVSGNKENFMGSEGTLQLASEIKFSFANTYVKIAETGDAWNAVQEDDQKWWEQVGNFFKAIWKSIEVPFIAIGELLTGTYQCVLIFIKFVGFMPE